MSDETTEPIDCDKVEATLIYALDCADANPARCAVTHRNTLAAALAAVRELRASRAAEAAPAPQDAAARLGALLTRALGMFDDALESAVNEAEQLKAADNE